MILNINISTILNAIIREKQVLMLFFLIEIILSLLLWLITNKGGKVYKSQTIKLTDKISIPNSVGQGQYGTSWWMSIKELKNIFKPNKIKKN